VKFLVLAALVLAHDAEQWIADKALTDPSSNQFCCGPSDCTVLPDDAVAEVKDGYQVTITPREIGEPALKQFVPYSRALPFAPDARYHACFRYQDGKKEIRCFIVPPGQS